MKAADVRMLDFSQTVGMINEPNRCSGGARTIRRIVQETFLPAGSVIVEIGSNTGYSSIEFALNRPDCSVIGIDINAQSVRVSAEKARRHGVKNVEFRVSDGRGTGLETHSVDLLFVSNVTSFIDGKDAALQEYRRILKPGGILVAVPIYYVETPPPAIKLAVEQAISAKIEENTKDYWLSLFSERFGGSRLFFEEDYRYDDLDRSAITGYCDTVASNSGVDDPDVLAALSGRLAYFFELFNENLRYCGFSILLFRNTAANSEPELHTSYLVKK